MWIELLQLDKVGTEDNFFELGGNSLLAVKTLASLKQQGYDLSVSRFYQNPTIKAIVGFFETTNTSNLKSVDTKQYIIGDDHDIAVIGMSARFPGADNIQELWSLLVEGKEAIRFFSDEELHPAIPDHLRNDPKYVKGRGVISNVKEFDASFFGINPKLAEVMDPQHRVFLEIAWEALENAGYTSGKYAGRIGVFAGCENNTYYTNNVLANKELIENVGQLQVVTVNDKDYLSSRVAYALNLKGPAMTVQSACSTSLLTIAQAVESVRKGQCDIALAGGVAINCPMNSGHLYQEGAMLSKDGHCRPFDADAQGTVFSDGAGVVLLKNKKQAEADGDTIYAIVKGVGINNDGGGKASFTAPSTDGQASVIKMALKDADVDPSTISYVETHGTATPLGDPIEIEGLNNAFGSQKRKQYCAIGSIKSNIGHLSTAAGVAGFIKTVLALHHKQIPPSLNFTKPNPNIDFKNSPFYVNTKLSQWQCNSIRRAGVSSFGVGGTNVHAILEEYNSVEKESSQGRPFHLINWSAKTEISRELYTENLVNYFEKNSNINLADAAFTLQHHRKDFNCRRFVIASDYQQAVENLKKSSSASQTKNLKEAFNGIVFMFPGQGSQYINMGSELYAHEAVFKLTVDECADLLQDELQLDIRSIIFPESCDEISEAKLKNTCFAQPALFTIEYALAKLWMSWGINPDIFIGHSIGEFVAAHLAGVFNLKDALKLIATRGRMMSELPGGSMLSVKMPAQKVEKLLPAELSIAAINSPNLCVVSGPDEIVKLFVRKLEAEEVPNRLLHTSHAFHSYMMDPIVEPFKEVIQSIKLNPNKLPIVSTVTGKLLTEAEATDPLYWANHLRATVRFSDALCTVVEDGKLLLLEVGPKNTTATLARQQVMQKAAGIVSTLEIGDNEKAESISVLKALGQLWLHGAEPDWLAFYAGQNRNRLDLPSYAFDRKPCWVEPMQTNVMQNSVFQVITEKKDFVKSENRFESEPSSSRKDSLINQLKKILEEVSGFEVNSFTLNSNFIELGLDSLLLTQIALTLKKEFQLPITFRMLNTECNSLSLLADYIDKNLPEEIITKPVSNNTPVAPPNSILN